MSEESKKPEEGESTLSHEAPPAWQTVPAPAYQPPAQPQAPPSPTGAPPQGYQTIPG